MTKIVKFQREHTLYIKQQTRDLLENADFTLDHYAAFESQKHSYSIAVNGKIVACCGVVEIWRGRAEAWALIDKDIKHSFVQAFKAFKEILAAIDTPRIEALVRTDFPQGHKLVYMLGFRCEAPRMAKYGITGEDYSLYSRVV